MQGVSRYCLRVELTPFGWHNKRRVPLATAGLFLCAGRFTINPEFDAFLDKSAVGLPGNGTASPARCHSSRGQAGALERNAPQGRGCRPRPIDGSISRTQRNGDDLRPDTGEQAMIARGPRQPRRRHTRTGTAPCAPPAIGAREKLTGYCPNTTAMPHRAH
jgi:hypothetical protein